MQPQVRELELNKALVESGAWPLGEDLVHARPGQAELYQSSRHVNPIGPAESLDQQFWIPSIRQHFVMLEDHVRNFRYPLGLTGFKQICARQSNGGAEIVEGAIR